MTCAAFAAVDARIMTPAFANVLVFWTPVTRATIVTSPLTACRAKWKLSLEPHMVPAPRSVKTPLANVALPATPVAPTSWFVHGLGRPPPPPAAVVNVHVSDVPIMFGFTGVAFERETTFQKYCVPPCSGNDGVNE